MPRRNRIQEVFPRPNALRWSVFSRRSRKPFEASKPILVLILTVISAWPGGSSAAQSADDPLRFASRLVQDVRAFPKVLVQRPSALFGAAVVGVGLVSYRDAQWGASLQGWHRREVWRVVEEFGDANAMRPAATIVFVGSLFQDDHRFQDAAFTGLEAMILANLLTNGLKALGGRSRPWQEDGANDWEPFSGNTSFPSGHATTAFALMTPWIMYFDNPLAWIGMGVAAASSISRVTLRYHWPSDVLAGAVIGSSVSIWLARRHQRNMLPESSLPSQRRLQVDPVMGPGHAGLRVIF